MAMNNKELSRGDRRRVQKTSEILKVQEVPRTLSPVPPPPPQGRRPWNDKFKQVTVDDNPAGVRWIKLVI